MKILVIAMFIVSFSFVITSKQKSQVLIINSYHKGFWSDPGGKVEKGEYIIDAIRRLGASLRMITDGDITAALAPALPDSGVDLYMGIGGSPECVLSAAGMRCLGGGLQAKIWVIDDAEKQFLIEEGWEDRIDKVFLSRDLARGKNILFFDKLSDNFNQ